MFHDNNLFLFLFSIVPALLYAILIYKRIPPGNIKLRASIGYVVIGMLAPIFVYAMYFIFPNWGAPIQYDYASYHMDEESKKITYLPTFFSFLFNMFIQVAFLEEGCKWLSCQFTNIVRGSWVKKDSPVATMYYYCMGATGFAIVENISYVTRGVSKALIEQNPESILIDRSVSSVIIHMLCGLVMGYFIAVGRQFKALKRILYTLAGISAAAILHGFYDFNLIVSSKQEYITINDKVNFHVGNTQLIVMALLLVYYMKKHLSTISYNLLGSDS